LVSPVYTSPVEHKCHNILEISYPSLSVQSWFASIIKIKLRVLIQQKSLQNEQHRTWSHHTLLKKKVGERAQPIPFQQRVTPLLNQWSNLGRPEEVPAKGTNHFTILKLVVQLELDYETCRVHAGKKMHIKFCCEKCQTEKPTRCHIHRWQVNINSFSPLLKHPF